MDWSLALVSQGIESTIEPPSINGSWALLIAPTDSERAFKTLRLYHTENRHVLWPQPLPWPETHFDWTSVAWAVSLVVVYWISGIQPDVLKCGIMDSTLVLSGQWWRMLTAMTLHADLAHLGENLSIGIVLLGLAMGQYGTGTGLLAACFAGVAGNGVSLMLNSKPFEGLGASGMIMGALGLLAAQSLLPRHHPRPSLKFLLGGVIAGVMLFTLLGLSPGSDIPAHLGGFVAGLFIGGVLVYLPAAWLRNHYVNLACGILFGILAGMTWCLALTHK
jgi:rhomboid protease GluP